MHARDALLLDWYSVHVNESDGKKVSIHGIECCGNGRCLRAGWIAPWRVGASSSWHRRRRHRLRPPRSGSDRATTTERHRSPSQTSSSVRSYCYLSPSCSHQLVCDRAPSSLPCQTAPRTTAHRGSALPSTRLRLSQGQAMHRDPPSPCI
jgi:hypothetical protein